MRIRGLLICTLLPLLAFELVVRNRGTAGSLLQLARTAIHHVT